MYSQHSVFYILSHKIKKIIINLDTISLLMIFGKEKINEKKCNFYRGARHNGSGEEVAATNVEVLWMKLHC